MNNAMQDLRRIERGIRKLEEHHNDVLDLSAATTDKIADFKEAISAETARLHSQVDALRSEIRTRIAKAKRATVILSLLAGKEELAPLKNRVEQQPYEFYATSDWFKKQLSEQP